jgi:hypothetical protein
MAKIDAIDVPKLIFPEAAAPSTPASAKVIIYAKSDGLMYSKDDAGTEVVMSGGGGGSGALVLLEQHTASASATLDFTTFISSTYDEYMIDGVDISPANDNVSLMMRVGTGGGPTYDTSSVYSYMMNGQTHADTNVHAGSVSATSIFLAVNVSNGATYCINAFSIRAFNLQSTARRKGFHGTSIITNNTPAHVAYTLGGAWQTDGTAVTALRFLFSAGNIANGTIRIYGLAK